MDSISTRGQRLLFLALLTVVPITAIGQPAYKLSSKPIVTEFVTADWNGRVTFPNVYCLDMPMPTKAKSMRQAFFNSNAIYLIDVPYAENLFAAIAVSTIPAHLSGESAIASVLENERNNEARARSAGFGYSVSEFATDFGRTVGIVMKNPSAGNSSGPFPLVRSFINNPKQPIVSMSVHRLFARGHDRFEVAAIQLAPQPYSESTESEMTTRLSAFADDMVRSLQKCTASIPVRVPK
jgi:hypothetical protein